jgi:glycosyltransferase involved in cell wall biosynthesis
VVLISHDLSQTGSPLLLVETATELQRSGAQVELVTLADDDHRSNLAARHDIKVAPLSESFAKAAQADLVIANTSETAAWVDEYLSIHPESGRSLVWWIHELNPDLYAGKMESLRKVPIAVFDSHASIKSWQLAGVGLPGITRVLYPCVDQQLIAKAMEWGAGDSQPAPIADSSPDSVASRSAVRNTLGLEAYDFVVTIVGTYHHLKGQDLFVNTVTSLLRQHRYLPLKAMVIGFGNEEAKLNFMNGLDEEGRKALNAERAVPIVDDLAPYYAASDAFVMNSQGLGENFGRVTIEAMTFNLPVLGTKAGGTPEVVDDPVTGFLHPLGVEGQQQLAEHILILMKDRKKAKAMGAAGCRRVLERFTGPRFYSELESILGVVLHSNALSA